MHLDAVARICFCKRSALWNFVKFIRKYLCRDPFHNDYARFNSFVQKTPNTNVGDWLSSPKQKSQFSQNKIILYNTMSPLQNLHFN